MDDTSNILSLSCLLSSYFLKTNNTYCPYCLIWSHCLALLFQSSLLVTIGVLCKITLRRVFLCANLINALSPLLCPPWCRPIINHLHKPLLRDSPEKAADMFKVPLYLPLPLWMPVISARSALFGSFITHAVPKTWRAVLICVFSALYCVKHVWGTLKNVDIYEHKCISLAHVSLNDQYRVASV